MPFASLKRNDKSSTNGTHVKGREDSTENHALFSRATRSNELDKAHMQTKEGSQSLFKEAVQSISRDSYDGNEEAETEIETTPSPFKKAPPPCQLRRFFLNHSKKP